MYNGKEATIQVVQGRGRYGDGRAKCHYRGRRDRYLTPIFPSGRPATLGNLENEPSQPQTLSLLLCNARSVKNKTNIIYDLLTDEEADLACFTETWLGDDSGPTWAQALPAGYCVIEQVRKSGRGGGVAVVYKDNLNLTRLPVRDLNHIECVYLSLKTRDRLGILLVYRPPRCLSDSLAELTELVSELVLESPRLLVLGDFNIPFGSGLSGAAREFMASMTNMGLSQLVSGPTHSAGRTLDAVFSSEQTDLWAEVVNASALSWTDHFLVRVNIMATIRPCRGGGPIKMVRPRRLMDPLGFQKALEGAMAGIVDDPVEALVNRWNQDLTRAIDTIAPKRPLRPASNRAPWYTEDLRKLKREGRRLERRWRKTRLISDKARHREHLRSYGVAIRAAKKAFFSDRIASANSRPAELFRVVKGLTQAPPSLNPVLEPSVVRCDAFNDHFTDKISRIRANLDAVVITEAEAEVSSNSVSRITLDQFQLVSTEDVDKLLGRVRKTTCPLDPCPSWLVAQGGDAVRLQLQHIVNASLREGSFPPCLKEAVVRPLLKKPSLDPLDLNNYRPVSNLPFLGKVIERAVAFQLQAVLDDTDFLDPFQTGFRAGYGVETAMVALVDDLRMSIDRGSVSLLVLLDLSAAFDTIDHGILLERLRGLGIGGTVLQWFRSYLSGRFQMVMLGDSCSSKKELLYGVPQGAILSPMLFNIYMKPLGEIIRRHGAGCYQYADDTQIYFSMPSITASAKDSVSPLNECLEAVMGWMRKNKLKLNPDKTEVLAVKGSDLGLEVCQPVLDGATLPLKDCVRSLGVLLDPLLQMTAQIDATARSAYYQLRLIRQLRPFLESEDLKTVVHALVTSRLDFCNALYIGLPLYLVRKLQLVQNMAARLVTGTPRGDHITPTLKSLHWLPISFRAKYKVLVITFKALHGLGPGYLRDRLLPYSPPRTLRSSGVSLLQSAKTRLTSVSQRTFSSVAPRLWNGLPEEIRKINSLCDFKAALKTSLFRQAYPDQC